MALAVVLLGALAGFLVVAASGAFAQTTTTDVTTSAVSNYNQAYALTTNNKLLCFDRDDPSNSNHSQSATIRNLNGDPLSESLVGIDFRTSDLQLYGVSDQSNVYRIDTTQDPKTCDNLTAVATYVSTLTNENNGKTIPLKGKIGMDFNPRNDSLRIVSSSDQKNNLKVDVDTGSTTVQSNLNYASGDPNHGTDPKVTAAAYTNSLPGAPDTTLYDIDTGLDILDTQQPVDDGTLNTQGNLGVNVKSINGFDIVTTFSSTAVTNTAYAALEPSTKDFSILYTVDLSSGAVTKVGKIVDQRGRTIVAEGLAIPIGG
jgi:hypothetical protein